MGLQSLLQNLIKGKPHGRKKERESIAKEETPVIEQAQETPTEQSEQRQSRLKRTKSIVFGDRPPTRKDRSPEKQTTRSRSRSILGRRSYKAPLSTDIPDVPVLPPRSEWDFQLPVTQPQNTVVQQEPQTDAAADSLQNSTVPPEEQAEQKMSRRERTKSFLFGNGVPALKEQEDGERRPRSRSVFSRRDSKIPAPIDVPEVPNVPLPLLMDMTPAEPRPRARSVAPHKHSRKPSSTDLPAVPLRDQSYDAQRSRSRSVARRREIGPPPVPKDVPDMPSCPPQQELSRGRQAEKTDTGNSSPRSKRRSRARTTTSPPARISPPPPPPPVTACLPSAARARSASRSRKTRSFVWASSSNPADDDGATSGARPPLPDLQQLRAQLTLASQSAASSEIAYNRGPTGKRDSAIFVSGAATAAAAAAAAAAKPAYVPRSAMKGFLQTTSMSPPSQARLEAAKKRRYTLAADSRPLLDRSEFVL